jgi:multidrug efflux pump subunit AcrA (membrane-fusion protein)
VHVLSPPLRNLTRVVGQPSFIDSYERTSIFSKPTAYISKWIVDIGDRVKKGDALANLFAPELVEDWGTKRATVQFDKERIDLAKEAVEVAKAEVKAADERLREAQVILDKYQAEVDRWDTEVKRLKMQMAGGIIVSEVLAESKSELKSSAAARDRAKATIKWAEAELLFRKAALEKAEVDVKVAEAALTVAESEEKYSKAWVDYLKLTAPFDGIIVARNANTYDFVLPTSGEPTAQVESPAHLSPSGAAAPIFVIERTDIVRIFVDVPEEDANYVDVGTKASVLVKAYRDEPIPAAVTRISWALNPTSRTLRTEIDLANPKGQLLPGTYAYVKLEIERPGVRALPLDAVTYTGDKAYCFLYENGHAMRTEIRTGVTDGEWIEVTNRRAPDAESSIGEVTWTPIDGSERVILGKLTSLSHGAPVHLEGSTGATKVARAQLKPGRGDMP